MSTDFEFLHYFKELLKMVVEIDSLRKELITRTADLQEYELNLFRLLVLNYYEGVTFLVDRATLINKLDNPEYCDKIYSISEYGVVTFYNDNNVPLIRVKLLQSIDEYISNVETDD